MRQHLAIGRIRTAFGTAGEIKVESYSGETAHFQRLSSVLIRRGRREHDYTVESVRIAHKTVIMKLAGIDTPEAAAALRGSELIVPRSAGAPLRDDEIYYADLEGLVVICGGREIGRVTTIWEAGSYPLLEITTDEAGRALVPFVDGFFGKVDLPEGTIELRSPEVLE